MFGHDLEWLEDYVVGRFGKVFEDIVGYGSGYWGFSRRCLVSCGDVVASFEVIV